MEFRGNRIPPRCEPAGSRVLSGRFLGRERAGRRIPNIIAGNYTKLSYTIRKDPARRRMTTNAQQQDSCTGVLMKRAWMKEEWRRAVGDMGPIGGVGLSYHCETRSLLRHG
jgi:hypothetical protein